MLMRFSLFAENERISCFSYFTRYDLLDVSINGPKEKLNSTVVSQVHCLF
jgi:hypothetical protein